MDRWQGRTPIIPESYLRRWQELDESADVRLAKERQAEFAARQETEQLLRQVKDLKAGGFKWNNYRRATQS